MKRKPTIIDLFSGCGGLSRGFMDAGYEVVLGVDNDDIALETFALNHDNARVLNLDLSDKKSIKKIKSVLGDESPDVVIGGPPCQGFSLTGTRRFDDKRNSLYLAMIDTVRELHPKAFLIENVPGIARLYGGSVKDEIISRLKKSGYNVDMKILCAADYGVPQMRRRAVFVGLKRSLGNFSFPKPTLTPDKYVSCESAIGDLPSREKELGTEEDDYESGPKTEYQRKMRREQKILFNHVATKHTELVKSVIRQVPEGRNHRCLPRGVGKSRNFHEAWTRYHSKKPSRTIDTGHRNHFHYKYDRIPTVRENARLQSFPDSFRFLGTRTDQNRQVGNAVPPLLGYNIAKEILRYLRP